MRVLSACSACVRPPALCVWPPSPLRTHFTGAGSWECPLERGVGLCTRTQGKSSGVGSFGGDGGAARAQGGC